MKLTDRRKKAFLAEFSRHGILVRAARAASPRASARYGAVQTFKDERERDPEFERRLDEAGADPAALRRLASAYWVADIDPAERPQ